MPKPGVWTIDDEGRTVFASDRMAEILGTTRSEMMGKSSFDYVFPEDAAAAKDLFRAKQGGHIEPFEFRLRRADGGAVWARVHGTPMFDDDGEFSGIVGTFTPI